MRILKQHWRCKDTFVTRVLRKARPAGVCDAAMKSRINSFNQFATSTCSHSNARALRTSFAMIYPKLSSASSHSLVWQVFSVGDPWESLKGKGKRLCRDTNVVANKLVDASLVWTLDRFIGFYQAHAALLLQSTRIPRIYSRCTHPYV